MRFKDQSLISWYRCSDAHGNKPVEIAVTRFNEPRREYILTAGDVGYYIMAKVSPKHIRCLPGTAVAAIASQPILQIR